MPDLTSLTSCGNIKLDGKIIASPFLIFNCSSDTINSPPLKSSFKKPHCRYGSISFKIIQLARSKLEK